MPPEPRLASFTLLASPRGVVLVQAPSQFNTHTSTSTEIRQSVAHLCAFPEAGGRGQTLAHGLYGHTRLSPCNTANACVSHSVLRLMRYLDLCDIYGNRWLLIGVAIINALPCCKHVYPHAGTGSCRSLMAVNHECAGLPGLQAVKVVALGAVEVGFEV